jgi:hypothetical protein
MYAESFGGYVGVKEVDIRQLSGDITVQVDRATLDGTTYLMIEGFGFKEVRFDFKDGTLTIGNGRKKGRPTPVKHLVRLHGAPYKRRDKSIKVTVHIPRHDVVVVDS